MTQGTPDIVTVTSLINVTETNSHHISPIISDHLSRIIGYEKGFVLTTLVGVLGIFTNTANICVYLKMGLAETTNISFFALSVSDMLVSMSAVLVQITYNPPVSVMKLSSGALVSEIGMAACFIMFPCMGCSAWITAILCIERCLCIYTPLRIKEIFTSKRTLFLILSMATYQTILIVLLYSYPGPPYNFPNHERSIFLNSSFSVPSFICFFIVLISTVLLVVKLKQNLEWRKKATKQSNKNSGSPKERKAARFVVAICTIFILCFTPNVALFFTGVAYSEFTQHDPYLGNLMVSLYAIVTMLQVLSSAVNIFVYYKMISKYRDVFKAMFYRQMDIKG